MAKKSTDATLARLIFSLLFLALALLLPFLTNQISFIDGRLLPMQFAVILCGFVCGPIWGLVVGVASPFLQMIIFDSVSLFPNAIVMAIELAAYAFVAGILYDKMEKNYFLTLVSLITAMVSGRLIWSAVTFILIFFDLTSGDISFSFVLSETVYNQIPGIVIQIIAIPVIVNVLRKNRLLLN